MKKWNYYNDVDPKVCEWAKELIKKGLVPDGEVDCRPIEQIQPEELKGFIQHHFFCGILGWPLALDLAGWPRTRPVWTGSCPCQPFSAAGKRKGQDDERHVWPEFFRLIRECRPDAVFGEQVEGAVGHGWLDGVFADLEGEGYTCGAAVLGAHSAGAPHMRQRLYWVADNRSARREMAILNNGDGIKKKGIRETNLLGGVSSSCQTGRAGGVSDTECVRCECQSVRPCATIQHSMDAQEESFLTTSAHGSGFRGLSNTNERAVIRGGECEFGATRQQVAQQGNGSHPSNHPDHRNEVGSYWSEFDILNFLDGKARRIEPGTFPLVDGLPRGVVPSCDISESYAQATSEARVMRLRGYGNAIVPQCAQAFIESYMEIQG